VNVDAISFDFYNTLATNRDGRGRGSRLMEYLEQHGFECDPWNHEVLYDVFEHHLQEYDPDGSAQVKHEYYCVLSRRVFERLNVRAPVTAAFDHAPALWKILGPSSFELFPEADAVVRKVKEAGLRTAVVSNWQGGLVHFCVELGLHSVDHVVASADFGAAKPDAAIFLEACRRLGTDPGRTLHVGDTVLDDLAGARRAGLRAVLIDRSGSTRSADTITQLDGILALL
jgi:HAD superfamily hydrolase (TIGR01549 family)